MQHLLNRCAVLLKNIPNKVNQRCAAAKFQKNPPKESAWHVQLSHLKVKDEMRDHRRIAFMLIIPVGPDYLRGDRGPPRLYEFCTRILVSLS